MLPLCGSSLLWIAEEQKLPLICHRADAGQTLLVCNRSYRVFPQKRDLVPAVTPPYPSYTFWKLQIFWCLQTGAPGVSIVVLCLQWRKELQVCILKLSKPRVSSLASYPFWTPSFAVNQCEHKHNFLKVVRFEQIKCGKAYKHTVSTPYKMWMFFINTGTFFYFHILIGNQWTSLNAYCMPGCVHVLSARVNS